jgi:hypothetical protein
VIRTLHNEPVDRPPRDIWIAPGVHMLRPDEVREVRTRFPTDFAQPDWKYPRGERAKGVPCKSSRYTDAWGCTWEVSRRGAAGEVRKPLLVELSEVAAYQPPWELLKRFNASAVNRSCAATTRFVLAWTEGRPCFRLRTLRGDAAASVDLARGIPEDRELLVRLLEFLGQEAAMWAETEVDGVALMDDWGPLATTLLESGLWSDSLLRCFRRCVEVLREADKFVFFDCGADASAVLDDLIEIGVDALTAPLHAPYSGELAERYRGQIAFWGPTDQQPILTRSSPKDVRIAVNRIREAVDYGQGGVIAQCRWELDVPLQSVIALFDQWNHPAAVRS